MSASLFDSPISVLPPPPLFPRRDNHPVPRKGIVEGPNIPIQTNKFYCNLNLGNQDQGAWTEPYLVWVNRDNAIFRRSTGFRLSISHTDPDQFAFGTDVPGTTSARYFISPIGIKSLSFSSTEFGPASSLTTNNHTPYSVDLNLHADLGRNGPTSKKITTHLVLGMGFVTARYYGLVPLLESGVFFRNLQRNQSPRPGVDKWKVILEDGKVWLIYVCPEGRPSLDLTLQNNSRIVGSYSFTGFIQIAKLPNASAESTIDDTAGAFPTCTTLSGTITTNYQIGTYKFTHSRYGQNNRNALLMYALPHHVASFEKTSTAAAVIPGVQLQCPTKGKATAVVADQWTLVEDYLPNAFTDWLPNNGVGVATGSVKAILQQTAQKEAALDIESASNLDSMYFSGKALAKYAQISLVICDVLQDRNAAQTALGKLKAAMNRFSQNRQMYPLVYDRVWRGIVTDQMYQKNDPLADFGNGCYNDHHFHYGYHIYTAAVIGHLDRVLNNSGDWVQVNKEWVNSLVRDVANPNSADPYYPVSRCFDWWHGHSWAKGLFESADGKDQESTSEDINCAYGLRLWASVIGDVSMEGRAFMMLAIMRRSFNSYFYLGPSNTIQPAKFVGNFVTGILFENKIDHATYFGLNEEYIHGIHMLPLLPVSPYVRLPSFVKQEWDAIVGTLAAAVTSGWKGVLYANLAMFDPQQSWNFFASDNFSDAWLDDGASRTWYLCLAAGSSAAIAAGQLDQVDFLNLPKSQQALKSKI